ncbi:MAG: hypothetical protein AB1505_33670, partial [Candidatus Latescibacterota bacterium]
PPRARREPPQEPEPEEAETETETAAAEAERTKLLEAVDLRVSLEDLERYLGVRVPAEDQVKLQRRLQQKLREPSIRAVLASMGGSGLTYALVPRVARFLKDGAEARTTVAKLLRTFPHLFDNAQQTIVKYRAEPFFVQHTPSPDYALVTAEAIRESCYRNYAQQRQVLKQYAHQFQANELRVRRRTLVEALYDVLVVQLVLKERLLSATVEVTDSKVGRQNLAVINYGAQGIRITDVSRLDTHAQLGACPSW